MGIPQQIDLGILGWADSLILMVLALVVFGPRRLPQIGRQIGKLMYEFRKASNDFKFQMEEELRSAEEADRRKKLEEDRLRAQAAKPPEAPALPPAAPSTPYSEDAVYPPCAPATEPPAKAPAVEETYPRILPPSTGEPVAATPPNRPTSEDPPQAQPEEPAETTSPVTEQAAQHG
jgi:sec-independent protein translocase protein TatB